MGKQKLPNDYFPHDFNARYDRKILRCRKVLGIEGYGIYWMLIEMLCTQDDFSYPVKDIDLLADDFGCSVEKVEAVVKQFELFQIDKQAKFFSLSLIARMQKYLELSEKARQNVNIRWEKARKLKELQQNNTAVIRPYWDGNTIKEKDIKEKEITGEELENLNLSRLVVYWNSCLTTPKRLEIELIDELNKKFGYDKSKNIIRQFAEGNFRSIKTMRNSLNDDGTIKPKENNGTNKGQYRKGDIDIDKYEREAATQRPAKE